MCERNLELKRPITVEAEDIIGSGYPKSEGYDATYKTVDNVNHPKHYEGSTSLECIEAMEVAFGFKAVGYFCLCNAFKYMWRYRNKNGMEDLNKANWYLRWIEHKVDLNFKFKKSFLKSFERLNDLYISIGDKIANKAITLDK